MESKKYKRRFEKRDLELNALLEITQAINNNIPESSLYKIYNFTLRANLQIKKLALYVFDEKWACKVNFGTIADFSKIEIPESLLSLKEITLLSPKDNGDFGEFDSLIPIYHKSKLLAIVFVGDLEKIEDGEEVDSTRFIQALSNIILVAIENKKMARRELLQEAMRKELEIARQVQQYLFPKHLPALPHFAMEASYLPHRNVGGDYYDCLLLDEDRYLVCIADVSGKGVPAAILMSNFQASLRTLVRKADTLTEVVEELNIQVRQSSNGENFITFFVALIDLKQKSLEYINAGHNPPVVISSDGQLQKLEKGTTVLGMFEPLPFIEAEKLFLESYLLFAYTDGVTETENESHDFYESERLEGFLIKESNGRDLKVLHQKLMAELEAFKGSVAYGDDITFLSCKVY